MISRMWRGDALVQNADAYERFVTRTVFASLRSMKGHCGAYLLRRDVSERVEFVAVTLWESLDSIRAFAGERIEAAVVEPEARKLLATFDDFVRHYDVAYGAMAKEDACAGLTKQ